MLQPITITTLEYDSKTAKKRAYARLYKGKFCILLMAQGITVSTVDQPLYPLLFDGQFLAFKSYADAQWCIDYIVNAQSANSPNFRRKLWFPQLKKGKTR